MMMMMMMLMMMIMMILIDDDDDDDGDDDDDDDGDDDDDDLSGQVYCLQFGAENIVAGLRLKLHSEAADQRARGDCR